MGLKSKKFRKIRISDKKKTKRKKKKNKLKYLYILLLIVFFIVIIPGIILGIRFKQNIIDELPDISKIENMQLSQTSVITDRNGKILYKMFEQNREYVPVDQISKHMQNAIIATEDKNFRNNPGIDIFGMVRAGIFDITHPNAPLQGGSTLTQQLIKNVFLTNEKTISRKLKEIVMALKIDNHIKDNLNKNYKNLSQKETERKVKEKILEIYLNYVFFGNNSYGAETASQKYFGKSADEINIFESSILASLPKAPSKYSPFNNKDLLMGEISVKNEAGKVIPFSGTIQKLTIEQFKENLEESSLTYYSDASSLLNFMEGLTDIKIEHKSKNYDIKYTPGRKDIVLARMYEEKYINKEKFTNAFLKGLAYDFKKRETNIKAPHFVFHVMDKLKEKFDNKTLMQGGLKIKTSLDYNIQKLAKKSIEENYSHIQKKGANNASMVYLNSNNGNILSYVGSADYNSGDIDGEVDMIQSLRQPGSSIKPLVYSMGFKNLKITPDSPIYDIPFKIGDNEPQNFDGKFLGFLPIRKALAYSRNIPAIKMFLAAGGENSFEDFLISLGTESIDKDRYYGYSMAIGAAEMTMMELANAYSHLSALGKPAEIDPILEIRGPDNSIIYKKEKQTQEQIIPSGIAYIIREILSDKANFPPNWRSNYTYKGINFGTKSGTTNVKLENDKKRPRDGWLATYTPSKVALFWAGNTNGDPLEQKAFGGWLNSPIWKSFMEKLENRGMIKNEEMPERGIKQISISKITGKLASYATPLPLTTKTLGYINNLPQEKSENIEKIKIDSLCNGKVSSLTPDSAIEEAYLIEPYSIMPNNRDLEDIKKRWKNEGEKQYSKKLEKPVFIEKPENECTERKKIEQEGKISLQMLKPEEGYDITKEFSLWYNINSPFDVERVKVSLNNIELEEYQYSGKKKITGVKNIKIPEFVDKGEAKLIIKAFDEKGYQDTKKININLTDSDGDKPFLVEDKIQTQKINGEHNITLLFRDETSYVKKGEIKQNGETIKEFEGNVTVIKVENKENLTYSITDAHGNKKEDEIPVK